MGAILTDGVKNFYYPRKTMYDSHSTDIHQLIKTAKIGPSILSPACHALHQVSVVMSIHIAP